MVLSGQRHQSGGLLWFTDEELNSSSFDVLFSKKLNALTNSDLFSGRPVRCKESGIHYHTSSQAADAIKKAGYKINPSHITSACKGNRPHAGGFTWEYSELTHEEIAELDQPPSIPRPSVKVSNADKEVSVFNQDTGELIGTFKSQSEAARSLGLSGAGTISVALKKGRAVKGYKFKVTELESSENQPKK